MHNSTYCTTFFFAILKFTLYWGLTNLQHNSSTKAQAL